MNNRLGVLVLCLCSIPMISRGELVTGVVGKCSLEKASGNADARAQAIEDAFQNALREYLQDKLPPEFPESVSRWLEKDFLPRARTYVETFSILEEGVVDNEYRIKIEVEFNDDMVLGDLARAGVLRTLNYLPAVAIVLTCENLNEEQCASFLSILTQTVSPDTVRYSPEVTRADVVIAVDVNVYEIKMPLLVFNRYGKAELNISAYMEPGHIYLTSAQKMFTSMTRKKEDPLSALFDETIHYAAKVFVPHAVDVWKKQYFRLQTYTIILENVFNLDRVKDFIEELKASQAYITEPKISLITPSGVGISFEAGALFKLIIRRMKSGQFGHFRTEINAIEGNTISLSIF